MLHAASAGDASARSMFARSYLTPIRNYLGHCWRDAKLGEAIDDAVQDVFVECFKPDGALVGDDLAGRLAEHEAASSAGATKNR